MTGRFLELGPGTSVLNFIIYLLASLLTINFLVFLSSSQSFVLTTIIGVPKENLGDTTGNLGFFDELLSLVMVYVWGLTSDKIGRRLVYSVGYLLIGISLFGYVHMPNVYPGLLLMRLVFALGASAATTMLTAVFADFASDRTRGKLSGIVGVTTSCGALLALFVFLRLPSSLSKDPQGLVDARSIRLTYYVVGAVALVFSIVLWFGLKQTKDGNLADSAAADLPRPLSITEVSSQTSLLGQSSNSGVSVAAVDITVEHSMAPNPSTSTKKESRHEKSISQIAWEGISAMRDVRVLLGYIGAFCARGDTLSLTLYLPLWFAKFYISQSLCPPSLNPGDSDAVKELCREAYSKASSVSGIAQVVALIAALLWGLANDRFSRVALVGWSGFIGAVGYFGMVASQDPTSGRTFAWTSLVGMGEAGMIVTSLALATDSAYVDPSVRGSVAGVYSVFGAVGVLLVTKVGGVLFDNWKESGAFLPMGVGHLTAFVVASVVGIVFVARRILKSEKPSSA
ncbi:hypothetical protein HDU93_004972 [Gonapodya sp. JEL0774]|nr:hypothetical protein HDU93_004972 [Gonapodya sp. JEL0774]